MLVQYQYAGVAHLKIHEDNEYRGLDSIQQFSIDHRLFARSSDDLASPLTSIPSAMISLTFIRGFNKRMDLERSSEHHAGISSNLFYL